MDNKAPPQPPSGMSWALRLSTDMVAATLIGTGIGYGLDEWLESDPWLTLVFFLFGVAAGFRNIYRAANPQ
ncbi:MAG: AtpZ/AtpI family protein [Magnetococcales bacterium]|nr:AtpZ/AtpI family protein [Magnetococcales bacterium]